MEEKSVAQRDHDVVWHPYTQMKTVGLPITITHGEGSYLIADDGKKYLDAISSWWVNLHGHTHPYIAKKVADQLHTLAHCIFAGFTHPGAVELAERLLQILPNNQAKVFYSDNGSTAVEVALKMCFQYWHHSPTPKTTIIAFENAYHGDTFGAMSVSGRSAFTAAFEKLLFHVEYLPLPNENNIEILLTQLSQLKTQTAAFIFEPLVQGTAGMQMYSANYLDQLIAHCQKEQILVIADEVLTGFGRTGKLFASDYLRNQPDIVCLSKGLTGGTMALGVTTCTQQLFNAFLSENPLKTLFHGHSFTANPIAISAALASLDLLLQSETQAAIQRIVTQHRQFAKKIEHHPRLKAVRQTGTILALEWQTPQNTSYFNQLRNQLYHFFLDAGIILRPLGNIIYLLPPYCITNSQLHYMYQKIEEALTCI